MTTIKFELKLLCPNCRGGTLHIEKDGDCFCKKCGEKNGITLKKACKK